MAYKYMKKCLTSLSIEEMQIKMALRFPSHPSPTVRTAVIKSTIINAIEGTGEKALAPM
jgi:hypothetical protein